MGQRGEIRRGTVNPNASCLVTSVKMHQDLIVAKLQSNEGYDITIHQKDDRDPWNRIPNRLPTIPRICLSIKDWWR
jgi:hypothetical protein